MDNLSIDAVVHTPNDALYTAPQTPTGDGSTTPILKLKGRQRLLMGLQRISSSPSLAKLTSSRSHGYNGTGRGSMSCVSLASSGYTNGLQYANSYESELSARFSTAPTSANGTPILGTPHSEFFGRRRARTIGRETPGTVALPRGAVTPDIKELDEDYFSRPVPSVESQKQGRADFNFWRDLPGELRTEVLSYLNPRGITRCSSVSKAWHAMCFNGQLWSNLDTSGYYHAIPAASLLKIVASAGPFIRDLNLRGCVQLRERWGSPGFSEACRNLENFSLEGCLIDRASIHCFLLQNSRLVHINLTGLSNADNATMKILGQQCPRLEHLNVTWCQRIDTQGLQHVVKGCSNLKDLRAGEIRGWDDTSIALELFKRNTLERLILTNCDSLTDEALTVLVQGIDPEQDFLTGRPIVPARQLKHLDLTRCRQLTDAGIKKLAHNVPHLEGLQLSKNPALTDAALLDLISSTPNLTHLDLEELDNLTNATLQRLASSPCAKSLQHLNISYCENLGDAGMLEVIRACPRLASLEMDNTRISDLTLTEAAAMVRGRNRLAGRWLNSRERPTVGLRIVAYDCANVTWTGVREILSRNTEAVRIQGLPRAGVTALSLQTDEESCNTSTSSIDLALASPTASVFSPISPTSSTFSPTSSTFPPTSPTTPTFSPTTTTFPHSSQQTTLHPPTIIALKCFYNWQPTVEEHTKRCLRGNFPAAQRLERKWAEWMILNEEAGAAGGRRRRRRVREAQMLHEEEDLFGGGEGVGGIGAGVGNGRRRRARSGPASVGTGCSVM